VPIVAIVAHRHELRVTLLLVNLLAFIGLITVGTLTPVPTLFAQELYNQLASIPPTPGAIFLHNLVVCSVEIVPVIGILLLMSSGFVTGLGLSAIDLIRGRNSLADLWLLLNAYPHTWLEFLAYTLAATEGTMVLLMLIAVGFRLLFTRELKIMILTFVICNLVLGFGSVLEVATILYGQMAIVAAWIPLGILLVAAVYYDAKRRGMKLPHPLIPLVLVETGTVLGFALPTLLVFAALLWLKHFKYKGARGGEGETVLQETEAKFPPTPQET
jgi:hypothetical protein